MDNIYEIISLLENALDCESHSPNHSGYTAREIHRKCLSAIKLLDQENTVLREMLETCKDNKTMYLGWGKGKDE
jgi:hypothetical protein